MQTVFAKFKIHGPICYLSHSETMTLFLRSCVRAGIDFAYSHGFNPRPKLSLPLPRTVGVESDDELLCVKLEDNSVFEADKFQISLNNQLPAGCEILKTTSAPLSIRPQPASAIYLLPLNSSYVTESLKDTISQLLATDSLMVQRTKSGKAPAKHVDVRKFILSIELKAGVIEVKYKISPAGTIRVEEILKLLQIDYTMLTGPVRRKLIQWEIDTCPAVAKLLNMKE